MKVLLINNDKGWSGGQEHLKDLASELRNNGVSVHFVVRAGSKSEARFSELGMPVLPLPKHGFGDVAALWKLIVLMRQERFDIVSVNREHDLLLAALAWHLAFPFRKPGKFMMSYHTATSRKQLMLGTVDAIVCISEHVRNKLLQGNPSAARKLSVLYYGIKVGAAPGPDKFTADRPRRFIQGVGFPLIGMVGEFWKNQGELIDMIPLIKKSFPSIKVVFVGDNNDQSFITPIMEKIRDTGLEDAVIFTGRVPRERILDIFFDFDLSVTTHRNEGFGIVHLESLAAGTPVVAYGEGGFVDIFRGEDAGVLVENGETGFAAAVIELLGDDGRRFRLGINGYDLVKRKYSIEAMGSRYFQFYRSLLGR
jgi:glycosyltransferase involved in cell wall biosynthesis